MTKFWVRIDLIIDFSHTILWGFVTFIDFHTSVQGHIRVLSLITQEKKKVVWSHKKYAIILNSMQEFGCCPIFHGSEVEENWLRTIFSMIFCGILTSYKYLKLEC